MPPSDSAHSPNHQRRQLLLSAAPLGLLSMGATGCQQGPTAMDRQLSFKTLHEAMAELTRLAQAPRLTPHTPWNWGQTLHHLAQSIEYSIAGFPEPKSALFQRTVGSAAFNVFAWRGRMSHPLDDPIPGAPSLGAGDDAAAALARLQAAMQTFAQHTGPLMPHFAYGALDKADYEQAHAMHLANHFSAFEVSAWEVTRGSAELDADSSV
jgi:hypothetical protein